LADWIQTLFSRHGPPKALIGENPQVSPFALRLFVRKTLENLAVRTLIWNANFFVFFWGLTISIPSAKAGLTIKSCGLIIKRWG
jgi:hypothetical protein